ncbi:MAG TPA: YdcF family protein [Candidatus Saccharimonadales bacterium]|jgi:hypothetical protein|nr:YdcF family protein [Candidatus Saccharimonadales bacterium]
MQFDAVLVLGGGVRGEEVVPPWVEARLNLVLEKYQAERVVLLSWGTTHKAPPLKADGFPVVEAVADANYLLKRGFKPTHIYTETSSYDTKGNAFFARVIHTDVRGWYRLHIITSEFHMARTQAIFSWIFSIDDPENRYRLSFEATPNIGIEPEALAKRERKEAAALSQITDESRQLATLAQVHQWLYSQHAAYAVDLMHPDEVWHDSY